MIKRKKQMLHRTQSKTTFTVMGVVFLGVAVILAIVALIINRNHQELSHIVQSSAFTVHRIDNITAVQDNAVQDLVSLSQVIRDPRQKLAIEEFAMDHYNNAAMLKRNINDTQASIETIQSLIKRNNVMLIIIIAVIIGQGIALYVIGLRIGNRIAGPLMVISRYLNDYIEGRNPQLRALRKDDELQEFYNLFAKAINQGMLKKDAGEQS